MPKSIPKGLNREQVLKALTDLDAEIQHSFGKATGYQLVFQGRRYAPKAVIGIALPSSTLIEAGTEHRLADPESLAMMAKVMERAGG
jgi:hypothetical protein